MTAKTTFPRRMTATAAVFASLTAALLHAAAPASATGLGYVEPGDKIIVATDDPRPGSTNLCTAGPYVQRGAQRGILTTGHCGETNAAVWSADGKRLGILNLSVDSGNTDVAFIALSGEQMSTRPVLAGDARTVKGIAPAAMLTANYHRTLTAVPICSKGTTSGERCGRVNTMSGAGMEAFLVADHGDSGSTVWTVIDGGHYVVGLLRGQREAPPYETVIEPIETLLSTVGATLLVEPAQS